MPADRVGLVFLARTIPDRRVRYDAAQLPDAMGLMVRRGKQISGVELAGLLQRRNRFKNVRDQGAKNPPGDSVEASVTPSLELMRASR
jgi:hypothetical protein